MSEELETMEFTGERFVPEEDGNIVLEHLHRYLQASEIVAGKTVLDIASGEGYGSAMLAQKAVSVIGVDISEEAIRHAKNRYIKDNLEFRVGSCAAIPLPDACVDMIVSFETIEHHDQHEKMMEEFKRVLRPGGLILISSPDKYHYSIAPTYSNPYHVKELFEAEFKQLIGSYFKNVVYFGQRITYGSGIFSEAPGTALRSYTSSGPKIEVATGMSKPLYWIALASDGQLPLLASGLLEQPVDESELMRAWQKVVMDREDQISQMRRTFIERVQEFNEELVRRDEEFLIRTEWALDLDRQLSEKHVEIRRITSSLSWRVTMPLREGVRWVTKPSSQARRYARALLRIGKRAYGELPLSPQTKETHRALLKKYAPRLLRASFAYSMADYPIQPRAVVGTPYTEFDINITGIKIASSTQPVVSVIIPIYGKINYTLRCLASIARNLPRVPFEVIVVNDCSPDHSADILSVVGGIQIISNRQNQGFIRSCNIGAKSAKGKYLCFLNNDTEVAPDWLDELVRTFYDFPGTGLAGSKLVYPNGILQEAGGIIWNDGSAWNFGRNQDQLRPEYSYSREVDYCSGASIAVPKSLFDEVSGFDEHYLPAYCEDSDLALKLRDKGYRVIYQALSVVVHYEGITSGTDTRQGAKAYQIVNLEKQFQRWQGRLLTHQPNGVDIDIAKDRMALRRVLVLDHCTPTPDQDAGSVVTFNMMLLLREMDFQVTFAAEDNFLFFPDYTPALQRAGIEVLYSPYCNSVSSHVKEFGSRYDLVLMFRPMVASQYLGVVRKYCARAKVLFHTVDLHYLRMSREAEMLNDAARLQAAIQMKQVEFDVIRAADATIVVSTMELDVLHAELPDKNIEVFPLILDVPGTEKAFNSRSDIVFVGGYQHAPNVDAVLHFVNDVMPLLRSRLPGVRFYIVGSNAPEQIKMLACDDVIFAGFVENLAPFLDKMRVSVAPLRFGAGIKGKIGTSMAAGLPAVATSLATEGMSLSSGLNILVADGTQAFADAVVQLYQDAALWDRISQVGIATAESAWGAEAARTALAEILQRLGLAVARNSRPLVLWRSTPDLKQSSLDVA